MTHDEAIQILTEHNKWRRGEPPYDGICPEYKMNVKELSEALDYAIVELSELPSLKEDIASALKTISELKERRAGNDSGAHGTQFDERIAEFQKYNLGNLYPKEGNLLIREMHAHIKELLNELEGLKFDITEALNTINEYAAEEEIKDALLKEAATDLEGYISAEHPYREQYKSEMLKYENDMDIVHRIRKELLK